jgi:hypothetical protein
VFKRKFILFFFFMSTAMQQVLECDDLVDHLLGFVPDQPKIAVMSRVNKAFQRSSAGAPAWRWGSDGFLLRRPTAERMRLLQVVRLRFESDRPLRALARWYDYEPTFVSVACSSVKQPRSADADMQYAVCNALSLLGSSDHTLEPSTSYMLDHPRTFVDVDFFPGYLYTNTAIEWRRRRYIPMCAQLVTMDTSQLFDAHKISLDPWLALPVSSASACALLVTACPHLDSLMLGNVRTSATEIDMFATIAPHLETLCVKLHDDTHGITSGYRWPKLTTLAVSTRGYSDVSVIHFLRALEAPHALRTLRVDHNRCGGEVMDVIAATCTSLTSLWLNFSSDSRATRNLLTTVGSQLTSLRICAEHKDVARYCPRLRTLKLHDASVKRPRDVLWDVSRGCPLLDELWVAGLDPTLRLADVRTVFGMRELCTFSCNLLLV